MTPFPPNLTFTPEAQEAAIETISWCRMEEGWVRQTKMFPAYANFLRDNAKAAERWLLRHGKP